MYHLRCTWDRYPKYNSCYPGNQFYIEKFLIYVMTDECSIQMSLPKTADDYIHQVGRVGRMGKDGKAITIISPGSEFVINRYSNEIGVPINKRNLKVKVKQA